jgi:hypothetical protein
VTHKITKFDNYVRVQLGVRSEGHFLSLTAGQFKACYTVSWSEPSEDCINFNPTQAAIQNVQGHWKVVVGNMWMLDFGGSQSNVQKALDIIKYYGFTNQCFVGRPNAPMIYFTK